MSRRARHRQAAMAAKRYDAHAAAADDSDDRLELDRLLMTLPGDDEQDDAHALHALEQARQVSRASVY